VFWSDNPAFDWQFINYYLIDYVGVNPFGYSARRIGDLYSGRLGRLSAHTEWKRMRQTKHSHNPVDDARGNAEALASIINAMEVDSANAVQAQRRRDESGDRGTVDPRPVGDSRAGAPSAGPGAGPFGFGEG
jgi:hypothetical protein